jgi:hypothetical protein
MLILQFCPQLVHLSFNKSKRTVGLFDNLMIPGVWCGPPGTNILIALMLARVSSRERTPCSDAEISSSDVFFTATLLSFPWVLAF